MWAPRKGARMGPSGFVYTFSLLFSLSILTPCSACGLTWALSFAPSGQAQLVSCSFPRAGALDSFPESWALDR